MPMPETAIDENNGVVSREHHVGLTGQRRAVKAIPEAQPEKRFSQGKFRRSVRAANLRHDAASSDSIE